METAEIQTKLKIMRSKQSWTVAATLPCLALITICSTLWACQKPARSRGEAVTRMVQLQEKGRYDDAVRVVQDWMSLHQDNPSQVEFLHIQIAIVYTIKAYHGLKRGESIQNAASQLEEAVKVHASEQPETADLDLLGVGAGYEALGELAEKDKCQYFAKARTVFHDQWPLIQGDSYTADGSTVPLEPVRAEVRKHLASVQEKSNQAGCNVPE